MDSFPPECSKVVYNNFTVNCITAVQTEQPPGENTNCISYHLHICVICSTNYELDGKRGGGWGETTNGSQVPEREANTTWRRKAQKWYS